ncbi:MAG TPA: hypothetical protein VFU48_08355 [Nitrospira sp.]|nr:hypothetical protein [Nitrospira sp.]
MTTTTSDKAKDAEPPLWSIGVAVAIMLFTPLVLYSFAPTGPVREGDTVFSDGQQRVQISKSISSQLDRADDTCLLDPNSPLIVVRSPTNQPDSSMIAHVQGNPAGEWPFCPVHTEVVLKAHQVFQKPAVFGTVREILVRLFSR